MSENLTPSIVAQEDRIKPAAEFLGEVDTDGMPLTGPEVAGLVVADLEGLVEQARAKLASLGDLSRAYAYPRVQWRVSLVVTPCYTDERPITLELTGGIAEPEVKSKDTPIAVEKIQPPVINADSKRPEKRKTSERKEEESSTPVHLNKMVREVPR